VLLADGVGFCVVLFDVGAIATDIRFEPLDRGAVARDSHAVAGRLSCFQVCSERFEFSLVLPDIALVAFDALVAPRALTMLLSQLSHPIAQWDPARSGHLPRHSAGTLVISRVETLNDRQQQELLDFLDDRSGAVQIISVATTELHQRVERGEFSEALFYRLNTIRIDADACLNESH
jgi:hypothetical protein